MAFKTGQSGNPSGRPRGANDRRSLFRTMIESSQEQLLQKAVDMALSGNEPMLKLLLDRLLPCKPKADTIDICLVTDNLVEKSRTVMQELSNGKITAIDANNLMQAIALESKIYEMEQMKRDVEELQRIVMNK